MKTLSQFKTFVENVEAASEYDDVIVYLQLKRWSVATYGDNPPHFVRRTLENIRGRFNEDQIARLLSVGRTAARGVSQ